MRIDGAKRILIIGISGAGKTTLALQLAKRLSLPVIHLDKYFWRPDWSMPDLSEWQEQLIQLSSGDSWIVDGNYASSYHVLMPKADVIVFFDFARSLSLYRILKRFIFSNGKHRVDLPEGCSERLDWSFIKYIWSFPKDRKPLLEEGLARFGQGKLIFRVSSPADVDELLSN